ncbi:protein FAM124B-like [Sinocyclocheilus rhinocerous]|uniref:protein FAM124B-like n=1 Tax=Sinocyclocheilus rhinocerous TaxID=307959 RepID=UPI0007BA05E1|nr:PREDICTED: protein FAM124B-like [Sinocyclocheilus rhinocerous]XP_016419597.1 PREDICTED: protein FAM124B-like [Sinocyclocheilus rhinocerous]
MSCSSTALSSVPGQELLLTVHLLTDPGASLLLQHTLDRLLKRVCPGLRLFHVSERACPVHAQRPAAGRPSHAVTIFLHESYGEERILRVLDFLQCPPWQYHHTESCGAGEPGVQASALLRPYLLPSRDFYSLGAGMPVWGVRPVHYGGEVVRVTLHSTYDNFEDTVRLYETVLQRRVEEQKTGFCWFTLLTEAGFSLQLAIKQLAPGVRVEPCYSAVLQFRVEEIGQLVPLLPNTCSPISASRWHTEDLDGNKILFQVKAPAQAQGFLRSAFPLSCPRMLLRSCGAARPPSTAPCRRTSHLKEQALLCVRSGRESAGSDGTRSSPPGSSCYSSQRSSPAGLSVNWYEPAITPETSLSRLRLEEEEPETNVDTGCAVKPQAALGASALLTLSRDLTHGLDEADESVKSVLAETQVDEFFI